MAGERRREGMGREAVVALAAEAIVAAGKAHCPYSRFPVGAALLSESGRVYRGANVENASYGLTLCAERSAIAAAVSNGERRFVGMAIASKPVPPATPCGACRQVLSEFCGAEFPVYLVSIRRPRSVDCVKLGELLPRMFQWKGRRGAGKRSGG